MPSNEVRQRRAARAASSMENDIEGNDKFSNASPHDDIKQKISQFKQLSQPPKSEAANPILRFLENYPSFVLIFLLVFVVGVYRLLKAPFS